MSFTIAIMLLVQPVAGALDPIQCSGPILNVPGQTEDCKSVADRLDQDVKQFIANTLKDEPLKASVVCSTNENGLEVEVSASKSVSSSCPRPCSLSDRQAQTQQRKNEALVQCNRFTDALNEMISTNGNLTESQKVICATGGSGSASGSASGGSGNIGLHVSDASCKNTASLIDQLVASASWETMRGCCREFVPGARKKKRYLNHHSTLFSKLPIVGGTMAVATATCKEACEAETTCTAVEVHANKKTRNKNRKKKTSKGFTCELHTANINSASRKSKTCKKAKCFTLLDQPSGCAQALAILG